MYTYIIVIVSISKLSINSFCRYTLKAHGSKKSPEKGLCVAWSGNTVASGGTDKVLKMFSFSDIIQ